MFQKNRTKYAYDDKYQLESETRCTSADVQLYKYEWAYDDSGNREWEKKWTSLNTWDHYTEYLYNEDNQLEDEDKYDDGNKTTWESHADYVYDGAGNMREKDVDDKTVANNDESWEYDYTYENQLELVEKDTAEVGDYEYNVLGNRVQREVNETTTTKYFYDGLNCVGDYDGTSIRYYITPDIDENLLVNYDSDYFFAHDGLGSVSVIVDTNQNSINLYEYDSFGLFYEPPTEGIDNRYTFTGREWDSESSLYYYRARYYFPEIGRFSSHDPVPNINLYFYASNNPVIFTDALGRAIARIDDLDWPCIVFGGAGGSWAQCYLKGKEWAEDPTITEVYVLEADLNSVRVGFASELLCYYQGGKIKFKYDCSECEPSNKKYYIEKAPFKYEWIEIADCGSELVKASGGTLDLPGNSPGLFLEMPSIATVSYKLEDEEAGRSVCRKNLVNSSMKSKMYKEAKKRYKTIPCPGEEPQGGCCINRKSLETSHIIGYLLSYLLLGFVLVVLHKYHETDKKVN